MYVQARKLRWGIPSFIVVLDYVFLGCRIPSTFVKHLVRSSATDETGLTKRSMPFVWAYGGCMVHSCSVLLSLSPHARSS